MGIVAKACEEGGDETEWMAQYPGIPWLKQAVMMIKLPMKIERSLEEKVSVYSRLAQRMHSNMVGRDIVFV